MLGTDTDVDASFLEIGTKAADIAAELWSGLGGDGEALSRLTFVGSGNLLCPFPVMDVAAASFGVAGLAVSELLAAAGMDAPTVMVDRRQATTWFDFPLAPSRFLDVVEEHGIHQKWMVEFQTLDDRWIRIQATYPSLRRRMLSALELPMSAGPEHVQRAIGALTADEAETRLVAAGAAAAVARTIDEWDRHPQGMAVAKESIADVRGTLPGGFAWRPTAGRPLLGLRVLDMTRVVAAPMATRFLASLGAEVLRIDRPGSDEVSLIGVHDVSLGKRWAVLDARSTEGRNDLRELIASTDVIVHGYRPGALDDLGLDADARATLRRGLVDVTLNAYGWTGPWSDRRGFDTLVQFSSGIADEISRWAGADPGRRLPINALGHHVDASRPRHMPVEALDFGTGYQMAAAALLGLVRRMKSGVGSYTRLSLARTARVVVDHAMEPADPTFRLPDDSAPVTEEIYGMGGRPTRRLAQPLVVDEVPMFWDRPAELPGSSMPVWSSPRPDSAESGPRA
ncbi:CoA transferase [Rhodococcus sp. NCIMB 12038]|uniref:CoA transferase n=1 Tax=Rhodococcus sp. NCIMB 12038 TaxID=933800 RepID=UPI000B3CAC88|nr:CoA transferase [Rhodococcus sp. NCIMB 12038]OUS93961.1 hypothetical protein CA951_21390 [Rhodococcus sp. NCIMB 12038]